MSSATTEGPSRSLQRELQTFRVKVNALTAHESFEAWRERDHDDLMVAVACAIWWGEQRRYKADIAF